MLASRKLELGYGAMIWLLVITFTYAVTRLLQAAIYPEPDPAMVVWSTRIAMYWRIGFGAYLGAMVAPLAYTWARRDQAAALKALPAFVGVTFASILLQALVRP